MIVPASAASSERSFSALRRLKTYLRVTMKQKRLTHVMLLHVHKERTSVLNLNDIMREFISRKDERKALFGKVVERPLFSQRRYALVQPMGMGGMKTVACNERFKITQLYTMFPCHDGVSLRTCANVYRQHEMERRRNERAGEAGYPREDPLTNGIVHHDSHLRKSGDPAGD
ncbi:hypothetical protein PR048_025018 [Dryococelus australis]|uniref:HAT C-terminal dimerisation domain-containing protein n=1 Tax=Dryococelus australis TaxID=614101 RepID=A0ABQ9GQ95_9NEOP|nr:hypothetical protein PR048_025018 [Dryococelus australis]